MERDYKEACYYIPSASYRSKMWPTGFSLLLHGESHEHWKWLDDQKYIVLHALKATMHFKYGGGEKGHVRFTMTDEGKKYVSMMAHKLNLALAKVLNRSDEAIELELAARAEEQILGLELADRYIRCE
jgi:hypothetical protein